MAEKEYLKKIFTKDDLRYELKFYQDKGWQYDSQLVCENSNTIVILFFRNKRSQCVIS